MTRSRPRTRAAIRGSFALAAVLALPPGAAGAAPADRKPDVAPLGTSAVGRIRETFVDDSRATMAVGNFPGAPSRSIQTTIFYPAKGTYVEDEIVDGAAPVKKKGPYPLILFSHGLTANASVYESEATEWVSAGYVVAAPNYPMSKSNAPGGAVFQSGLADVKNQPADASFVIDQVIRRVREETSLLAGLVDAKRIGASGHSLGGITTFALTYSDCCADKRIDAAAPMSGLAGLVADGNTYFGDIDTPLLILHGESDPLVPYGAGVDAFAKASGPKFLVTFTGGGHVTPFVGSEGVPGDVLIGASLAFWDRYLKGDRGALARLRGSVRDPVVATLQEDVTAA
jgi:dienelactone hydrolase